MEFLDKNTVNTTTIVAVESQTASVKNIMIRDESFQWSSNGWADDDTTTTITINFAATTTISRIALIGINWQDFTIYYNGVTANTLSLTSTGATTSSDWTSNSETSMFLRFDTIQASSISFDASQTIVADAEKAIGYLHISDTDIIFPRVPASKDYKPIFKPKQIVHRMSDGATRVHEIEKKYETKIKFKYITEAFRNDLFNTWKTQDEFVFVAFGTTTAWDEIIYPVVWPGNFDFYKFSTDAVNSGFSGTISLKETTT